MMLLLKDRPPPLQVHALLLLALLLMVGTKPELSEGLKCYACEGASCSDPGKKEVDCCTSPSVDKPADSNADLVYVCVRTVGGTVVESEGCALKAVADCQLKVVNSTDTCALASWTNADFHDKRDKMKNCKKLLAPGADGRQAGRQSTVNKEGACFCSSKDLCDPAAREPALTTTTACPKTTTPRTGTRPQSPHGLGKGNPPPPNTGSGYRLHPFSAPIMAFLLTLPIFHGYLQGMAAF